MKHIKLKLVENVARKWGGEGKKERQYAEDDRESK